MDIKVDPKLRLVVLDNPKSVMKDERARRLFEQMLLLKFEGYKKHYPADWIAADRSDYYATHMILCLEYSSGLVPIAAVKNNLLSRNRHFHDAFAPLAMVQASSDELAKASISRIIRDNDERGTDLIYSGSWCSDPAIRHDRELARQTKELVFASVMYQARALGIPQWICSGTVSTGKATLKERTHDHFVEMGMTPVTQVFGYSGLEVRLFLAERYSEEAMRIEERYRQVWESRVVLAEEPTAGVISLKSA
jgi:hypothetical protein